MFQTKVVQKIKTHILCSVTFSRKSCRLWDNVEKYGTVRQATDDNIIRRMRIACWITNATDTHSQYVILTAFPPQQWLRERPSILRYIYIACLVEIRLCGQELRREWFYLPVWYVFFYSAVISSTLKMEVLCYSETTLVYICGNT
jgi:hypothetical protein